MLFSVIYEFDVTGDTSVRHYTPSQRRLFSLTECHRTEYGYLGEDWEKGKHRKYGAILTRSEFERFLCDTGLIAEETETMGSIGAPGFGFGWAPAISFRGEAYDAIQSAYVTPLPLVKTRRQLKNTAGKELGERDWDRVKAAVVSQYRYGA